MLKSHLLEPEHASVKKHILLVLLVRNSPSNNGLKPFMLGIFDLLHSRHGKASPKLYTYIDSSEYKNRSHEYYRLNLGSTYSRSKETGLNPVRKTHQ